MRIAIIGGGPGGLAAAVALHRGGHAVSVYERAADAASLGLGFVLLDNGLRALGRMGLSERLAPRTRAIRTLELREAHGPALATHRVGTVAAIRRRCMVELLEAALPDGCVVRGAEVRDIAAEGVRLADGQAVRPDLVVAADGVRSGIRGRLFPHAVLRPTGVNELVGSVPLVGGDRMRKLCSPRAGIAFGTVPVPGGLVWYLQHDASRYPCPGNLRAFAESLVGDFPAPVPALLAHTDFREVHLWRTADMDPLPSLHGRLGGLPVVLVGDAAHPVPSFSSQGLNSALVDAVTLADALRAHPLDAALSRYGTRRAPALHRYLREGRALVAGFLEGRVAELPLVAA